MDKVSFVTNATQADAIRLKHFLPAVLQSLGEFISELIIVVDGKTESGRIAEFQQNQETEPLVIHELLQQVDDPRVRFVDLDYSQVQRISQKWFALDRVIRCQAGTPIFAFLFGIESCTSDYILRSDCDMVFFNRGFVQRSIELLPNYDVIQPPFLTDEAIPFSSRSFFINRKNIQSKLPLQMQYLDPIRIVHRWLKHRPIYMALEQTLEQNIRKGRIKKYYCPTTLGYSMHIPLRSDFKDITSVVDEFIHGHIPKAQLDAQHNYVKSYWSNEALNKNKGEQVHG